MKIEKMTLVELGKIYDSMQLQYGDKSLKSILFGGCIDSPDICFVFMNPTGKKCSVVSRMDRYAGTMDWDKKYLAAFK